MLNKQKEKGVAVIFVGEDLDVLLGLSDRIMVISSGKVSGIVDARKTSKEKLGMLMTSLPEDIEVFDETVEVYGKVNMENGGEEGTNV